MKTQTTTITLSSRKIVQGVDRCSKFIGMDATVKWAGLPAKIGVKLTERAERAIEEAPGIEVDRKQVVLLTTDALKLLFQYPEGSRVGNHIRELIAKE